MLFCCKRCEQKNLRCFVNTATGRCAGCISVKAECSLFVPEEEWEKVEKEKEAKRLELARFEEEVAAASSAAARAKRELLEIESRERQFARRDLALLKAQEQAQEAESSSTTTGLSVSEPLADPCWSQANDLCSDPSLDQLLVDFLAGNPSSLVEPWDWAHGPDTAPATGGSL